MEKRKLTASIWGAGFIAQTHAKVLHEMGVDIKLIYNRTQDKAESLAAICGAEIATTDESLLLETPVDVVHLCTPANLHYEQTVKLIEAGFNIFCEKPLTLNREEAISLEKLAEERGIITGLGFNVRYHQAIGRAKEIIQDPSFGKINLVHGAYLQEFHALPAFLDWRYDTRTGGKMRAVTEIGSHWMDLVQFLTGNKILGLSATFSSFSPERTLVDGMMYPKEVEGEKIKLESEDAAIITFKFEDGFIGNCVLSEASQGRTNMLSVEVTGERKNLWWQSEEVNNLYLAEKGKGFTTFRAAFGGGFEDTYRLMFKDFYRDIAKGKKRKDSTYPSFSDGARNVVLCQAVYESAMNDSKWVYIND
ncbi:MAG: Gfo/Idh/MocA family oxidoreductase [Tissierellia bacterium]|nr:Gfo/Idh/MocA family oxidoreductase [Tissierellia bacterium]